MTMRSTTIASLCATLGVLAIAAPGLAQQPPPRPAQATTPDARPGMVPPAETPPPTVGQTRRSERGALPQGFSVVLVLGDIQGATTADDVPPAARKALVDMRDFLPFKSYRLLDAAWIMCCGQQRQSGPVDRRPVSQNSPASTPTQMLSQVLRGPEDQEYELKLFTSRAESSQVFVRFTLFGSRTSAEVASESPSGASRTTARRIADLRDRRTLLEKQVQEARRKVEVGVAPGGDVAKLELELRRVDREIEDLSARVAEARAGRSDGRTNVEHQARNTIIDTSFTMDVGETVVVGTSRLRGGSKALIALLTAVPPRTTTERRE
jgi:hypothetical protein